MPQPFLVSLGQYSDKGRKQSNQDFHGACIANEPQRTSKGIAVALADGISSSAVSHIASQTAVASFLADYYCTSDAWSVKKSACRVLMATNAWLYAQTRQSQNRYDIDRGYVCTFSALVLKATSAHIFHVGDSRIARLRDGELECLTEEHRLRVSRDTSYLSRALGISPHVELDHRSLALEVGDLFVLTTDGVHEHLSAAAMTELIHAHGDDLDAAARALADAAYAHGSDDNLTVQLVRVEQLPHAESSELHQLLDELPLPPLLEPRMLFDGYRIVRPLYSSSRSHVYLAHDGDTPVVIKTPSIDRQQDRAHLERLLIEEWVARRIDNPYVLKAPPQVRRRNYLYTTSEFVEGQTLRQWMTDNRSPGLEQVRVLIEQIARGLQAFHRQEMLHQDLRPENVMIDSNGTPRLIDFGSAQVAGLQERETVAGNQLLGTAQYTATEYFLGESGSPRSDQFSLAVMTYELLSGELPYGAEVAKCRNAAEQNRLLYRPLRDGQRQVPAWLDDVLRKALQPNPQRRYTELSEFIHALRQPDAQALRKHRPPLLERAPVQFWRCTSLLLALVLIGLLISRQA